MTNYLKKYFAFTLAETLIVMGVIGIVSALTLPNLNASTGEKEKIAKVKKIYQNLDDALGRAQAVYGPYDEWTKNDTDIASQATRVGDRITEFMKVSKNCGITANLGCFSKKIIMMNGNSSSNNDSETNRYRVILADGTSVMIDKTGLIWIDIDGPRKGNGQFGHDIFFFRISNNTIVPSRPSEFGTYISMLQRLGTNASGWIIDYDNMDYLKFKDGKCPNGTVPTEQNPRCK